jgi:hypothetical protein
MAFTENKEECLKYLVEKEGKGMELVGFALPNVTEALSRQYADEQCRKCPSCEDMHTNG